MIGTFKIVSIIFVMYNEINYLMLLQGSDRYMKIDLHCHTKKAKKGDGKNRNVTATLFREKVALADVKIVAITNHNTFDLIQYNELQTAVSDICQVWPGIELDVIGETKYHLIIVTKPEVAESFDNITSKFLEGETPDSSMHTLEEICETYRMFDAIYIPHFHDKKPAISANDKDKLVELVGDSSRVFIEPRNHRTLGVLANKDMSVLIGSDVQDWNTYENSTFAELRLPVGSFSELIMLARRDTTVVDTLLNKKPPVALKGRPHKSVELPISIYPDVNIIFGQKGTGKTEILVSLYEEMVQAGKKCKKYIAAERNDEFSALTNIKDMEQDLEKVHAIPCEAEFLFLSRWTDENPTLFASYIDWSKTKGNSNNKTRMKITDAVHDNFHRSIDSSIHKADFDNIRQVGSAIKKIELSTYMSDEDVRELSHLINKLQLAIKQVHVNDLVTEYASKLTNWSIDTIKALADKSSDTVSRPSTAGLNRFVDNRLELLRAVNTIIQNLSVDEFNEKVKIGSLDGKGDIYVNYKYRMVCPEERTENFPGQKITVLREIKDKLLLLKEHIFDVNIATLIEEIVILCETNNISSVRPFLGRSKQIVTSDGELYTPSNGEKGILLLEHTLYDEADAYFLDEPELGMGNSYINSDIRPLISALAKRRKYVIVATHNANIAVRTLPYMSIFRTHENGAYNTYAGNPFDDQLRNINNPKDIRSWTEESMHSLEGGQEAFYERKDIYESRNNQS